MTGHSGVRFKIKFLTSGKFHCRLTLLFIFLLAILLLVRLELFKWHLFPREDTEKDILITNTSSIKTNVSAKHSEKLERPKLVLFYTTTLLGGSPWPGIKTDYEFNNPWNVPCKVRNCRISYEKKDLNISDAVVFHGPDIAHLDVSKLSKTIKHRAKQRWTFFTHESPDFFNIDLAGTMKDIFNWTMSYKLDSDIFVPYTYYFPKSGKHLENEVNSGSQDYSEGKDRLVAWMVSHCGKKRDKVVKKLMEYIPVHVYGKCAPTFSQNRACNRWDKNCLKTLRRYKFYLAFENSFCIDYITEKYWTTSLQNDIVPVVLGGGNYSNRNLAVPGSFINVIDFKSVKDLADYLLMLDRNNTAYNEYFSWKERYYVDVHGIQPPAPCQICAMLNDDSLPIKSYDHQQFQKFWGPEDNCRFLNDKVDQIISV